MIDTNQPEFRALLNQTARQHLAWLEAWAQQQPIAEVSGANLLQACTYDLIQVFNNVFLSAYLAEHTATEVPDA